MSELRRIIASPDEIKQQIHKNIIEAIKSKFPMEGGDNIASLDNVYIKESDLSHNKQKALLLSKGNASEGLYGDVTITNSKSNKVIGSAKNIRLMSIPVYTNRFTFLVDGNEYNVVSQLRTKSGCYTRKRGNDTLESSFNLSKGANFKLLMDPSTGKFTIELLHATLPMYGFLKILGADDALIKSKLGTELFKTNSVVSTTQMDRTINTLYDKLISYKLAKKGIGGVATKDEKQKAIKDYFLNTEISPETTKLTLGTPYNNITYNTILDAANKILRVFNQEDNIDERDNLEFQKVHTVEDIVKEVLTKNTTDMYKIKSKLAGFKEGDSEEDIKKIFSPVYFSKPLKSFITTSSISRLPTQINPVEIIDGSAIVTKLGEGAITSERAVPDETRSVSPSYAGLIDAVATPESSHVGVDNRFTIAAIKGSDNELYRELVNAKTGKVEIVRTIDTVDKYVGIPEALYIKDKKPTDTVTALYMGKFVKVPRNKLDYYLESPHMMSTITTNSIPFISSSQGNRLLMGAKHVQQAMPLKYREERLVTAPMSSWGVGSIQSLIGKMLLPRASTDGVVSNIDDDYIYIKSSDDKKIYKVDYANNLPLATKTMLHNDLLVKIGDKVTNGQILAESNFTKNGNLALGKNLKVAYMPYKGLNHEDGIVISESAAHKLTSIHANKITVALDKLKIADKKKFSLVFPREYTKEQLNKLDASGVAKKGEVLHNGDPIILLLEDNSNSVKNQILGLVHKSLIHKYANVSSIFDGDHPAEVLDVFNAGNTITVLLKEEKEAVIGDKLSGSWGNKGVITKIIPDDEMVKGSDGKPIDALFTPVGVIGRINPAQLLDTTLGKVATKTGKPYEVENFSKEDNLQFVKDELNKHGLKDTEDLVDPLTGKTIPDVFTGVHHTYKLFKTTDTNFAARGIEGPHDQDEAPVGSGIEGPKALGGMEVNALIAHNARALLKEGSLLRNSKNIEFWKQFQYGGIPHLPTEKKTFTKFTNILKQAGIKVDRQDNDLSIGPLTDKDILEQSNGEVTDGSQLNYKLEPEPGGLFDQAITGGLNGTKWSHIQLAEPVVNPIFESCIQSLIGGTKKNVTTTFVKEGGDALKKKLNSINIDNEISATEKNLDNPKLVGDQLNAQVKKLKYLKALKSTGLKAGDAYMLSYVPVTPPAIRPIIISPTGDRMGGDSNLLYRDLILQNNAYKKVLEQKDSSMVPENRESLYKRVKELTGVLAPENPMLKNRGVKGALSFVAGDTPKRGFFQRKVIYSKMNLSGRATISPDNTLGLDELGMPVDMAWNLYKPFIIRKLVQYGRSVLEAKEEVDTRSKAATAILNEEMKERPVLINRAPTLWKNSIHAAYPKLREGKTLYVNTLWESSSNADFDGDSIVGAVFFREKKVYHDSKIMLDNENKMSYCKFNDGTISVPENKLFEEEQNNMSFLKIKTVCNHGLVDLASFPRLEETKVVEGNVEKYKVPEGIEVLTVDNGKMVWGAVEEFSIHKDLKMVECKTSTSRTITCSLDHSLMTVDENLNYVKAMPEVGLSIPRLASAPVCGTLETITFKNSENSKYKTKENIPLDYDFGWMTGAAIGDAWVDDANNISLAKVDVAFRDKFFKIVSSCIVDGETIPRRVHPNPHYYDGHESYSEKMVFSCYPLLNYFKEHIGQGAKNKHLPTFWMQTPIEFRKGLLSGLISSDGTVSEIKAKSKAKSQWNISYTSISSKLIFEMVALAGSLGLTATAGFSKYTEAGNASWYVTFNTESIAKIQKEYTLYHSEKSKRLASANICLDKVNVNKFTPKLTDKRLDELISVLHYKNLKKTHLELTSEDNKHINSIKECIKRTRNDRTVLTKETAFNVIKYLKIEGNLIKDAFWTKWVGMIEDPTIEWEIVKEIRSVPLTTAYDLTIPPAYTMVTESLLIVSDTETIHVPVSAEAVEDAKKMMPSKLVFSDKKLDTILMAPKGEAVAGLYKATQNLEGSPSGARPKKFKTEADAWKAYYEGTLHATDLVDIG